MHKSMGHGIETDHGVAVEILLYSVYNVNKKFRTKGGAYA